MPRELKSISRTVSATYLPRYPCYLTEFSACFLALRYATRGFQSMTTLNEGADLLHVHLVTIEIGVVRRCPAWP